MLILSAKRPNRLYSADRVLECCWEQYDNTKRVFDDKIGDWLWRPNIGFARITSQQKNRNQANIHVRARATDLQNAVYLNYYLNIRQLQARDTKLRSLMNKLNISICEFGL